MEFSVVVPTYKRTEKLQKCLESLAGQDFDGPYEIIVIEDSVESDARGLVEEIRIQKSEFRNQKGKENKGGLVDIIYLSQVHRGPAAARNKGIKKARGKYIAFTDDDCVAPPDWLVKLKEGFEKYQDVAGAGGYMEAPAKILAKNVFAQYESYMTRKVYGAGEEEIVGGFEIPTGGTNNIAYRKDVLEEVGGFDESFPTAAGEDADLKKRICDKGYKIAYLPLKVEHQHGFFTSPFPKNFYHFCSQSWKRGIGSAYFHKKHGGGLGRGRLILSLILLPFRFAKELIFGRELSRSAACAKYVAVFFDTLAQLTS